MRADFYSPHYLDVAVSILHLEGSAAPRQIYAIGDIHGRLDLLKIMVKLIAADLDQYGREGALVVTLGDIVDRGPDSREVIELLAGNPFKVPYVAIAGNHEQMFLDFMGHPRRGMGWCRQGGIETLRSYTVPTAGIMMGRGLSAAAETLEWVMPPHHQQFLRSMRWGVRVPGFFLCHAGVRPGVPLDEQTPEDLFWIREEFLDSKEDFGAMVVHGHTVVPQIDVRSNRINIDTGAYQSGKLSCAVLDHDQCYSLVAELP
ncbi:serine/threonine protein phosphatase [Ancylobacter sp. 6x-1]|uniref:Serine/threonine protein phosphatase n=1 Tax=Ancylobacter crimeensis TaxID=2579147 RepID=A0ABT0D6L6_9HYPH|nr:metallophosphoesterase family protein [Ancylobacter crimeensis]MCK0195590.1 serine/threonine protein phosphatase [Ancylobacter crimeensis]